MQDDAYMVEVTEGDFLLSERIDICRSCDCTGGNCIGQGALLYMQEAAPRYNVMAVAWPGICNAHSRHGAGECGE